MIEMQCPWCEGVVLVEPAAIVAPETVVRCDGCGVAVEVGDRPEATALPLAA
jgi:hypothetical protein